MILDPMTPSEMTFMRPQSDKFRIKNGNLYSFFEIVDCRFENLFVDVDFAQKQFIRKLIISIADNVVRVFTPRNR